MDMKEVLKKVQSIYDEMVRLVEGLREDKIKSSAFLDSLNSREKGINGREEAIIPREREAKKVEDIVAFRKEAEQISAAENAKRNDVNAERTAVKDMETRIKKELSDIRIGLERKQEDLNKGRVKLRDDTVALEDRRAKLKEEVLAEVKAKLS